MAVEGFRFDSGPLDKGLSLFQNRAALAVRMYAETAAQKFQTHAVRNRKWTDRSGRARQTLRAYVEALPSAYRVNLAHGVDYGIWLELANGKNFAIIQPTILALSPEIMAGLEKLLEKMG